MLLKENLGLHLDDVGHVLRGLDLLLGLGDGIALLQIGHLLHLLPPILNHYPYGRLGLLPSVLRAIDLVLIACLRLLISHLLLPHQHLIKIPFLGLVEVTR